MKTDRLGRFAAPNHLCSVQGSVLKHGCVGLFVIEVSGHVLTCIHGQRALLSDADMLGLLEPISAHSKYAGDRWLRES